MRTRFRLWLLTAITVALVGYGAVCSVLYVEQRRIMYAPSHARVGDPPAGSGFAPLEVFVPGLGRLHDWQAQPATAKSPTIIFFYGNASDLTEFFDLGQRLHARGWGVILASYRGYSGNPGEPTEAGLMTDARATIAAAPHGGPIILWGYSLGSGVAARMASEGRASGLVLEAPYTSMTDLAVARYPYVPVGWLLLDRYDTRASLDRIRAPVLIIHSTDDPTVPYAMGRDLAGRFGKRATLVTLTGLGHFPHQIDLEPTVLTWAAGQHLSD